jgi:hypothetical protein
MIRDVATAIVVGFAHWYLANHRVWERERIRLWKLGFSPMDMPTEPESNRGRTTIEMRCRMVTWMEATA